MNNKRQEKLKNIILWIFFIAKLINIEQYKKNHSKLITFSVRVQIKKRATQKIVVLSFEKRSIMMKSMAKKRDQFMMTSSIVNYLSLKTLRKLCTHSHTSTVSNKVLFVLLVTSFYWGGFFSTKCLVIS